MRASLYSYYSIPIIRVSIPIIIFLLSESLFLLLYSYYPSLYSYYSIPIIRVSIPIILFLLSESLFLLFYSYYPSLYSYYSIPIIRVSIPIIRVSIIARCVRVSIPECLLALLNYQLKPCFKNFPPTELQQRKEAYTYGGGGGHGQEQQSAFLHPHQVRAKLNLYTAAS